VSTKLALHAARVHYENRPQESLDPRTWLAAVRRVRHVLANRPRPMPDQREVLALARIGAASHAQACPVCPADVGQSCINAITGAPMAHGWHHQRTIAPVRVGA